MKTTMMKDASDWEAFAEEEKDQFALFVKAKKEFSCTQETELQQEEETETIERLESRTER